MSLSRADFIRFALPLAGIALVLTACGSSTSSTTSTDEAEPAAATSVTAEVAEPEEMGSEEMGSEEMESEVAGAEEIEPAAGSFITLADYEGSKDIYAGNDVVLFFNASWCSTCKEARENLEADPIPAGLTIVKVDFDDSDELRQKYGVTVQHTFVQIDSDGNELAKWNGSVTADEIASQTT